MRILSTWSRQKRFARLMGIVGAVSLLLVSVFGGVGAVAQAAPLSRPNAATAPGLGQADPFSVLGKAGVTNSGPSVLSGNVGADSSITGFPPGTAANKVFAPVGPEGDATSAYTALTSQGPGTNLGPNLNGLEVGPGVYAVGSALLTTVFTLNGPGVYVFLVSSDLTSSGTVNLINGAAPCSVFWAVTSSASLAGSFVGTIIAQASVTMVSGVHLEGRALALTGNVTLDNDSISGPSCAGAPGPGGTATPSVTPGGPTLTPSATFTPTQSAPSYVGVEFDCAINGLGEVRVGLSAGVIVYGLGPDITSATDTALNKIVIHLPIGHYDWHATPPAGHYMQSTAAGAVDIVACLTTTSSTAVPGATVAPGATASATVAAPVLLPVTGADLSAEHALALRQMGMFGLGFLGLGLVALGFGLRRKRGA